MLNTIARTLTTQTHHDTMVSAWASDLKEKGYTVYADIKGYSKPPEFSGHIPDIYAFNFEHKIVGEVETCDSIGSDHTKEQYTAFSRVNGAEFHVMVPKSCLEEAKAYARQWGIRVDMWWKYG